MLSVSPKQALNSLIKSAQLLSKDDCFSRSGANHDKAEPLSNVPIRLIRDASVGYWEGCIWMTKHTWLRNPLNCDHVPSNFTGSLILVSLWNPWGLDPCCWNTTMVASSCCTRNANSPCCFCNSPCCCYVCYFSSAICCRSPNNHWFSCSKATNFSFGPCSSKKTDWYSWVLTIAIVLEKEVRGWGKTKRRLEGNLVQTVRNSTQIERERERISTGEGN